MILEIDILVQDFGDNMTIIHITKEIEKQFKSHGENEYPHECCGFILGHFKGKESHGLEYLPATNVKEENRERRFLIDPQAYQNAEDEADEKGLSVISIVHSHPDHPHEPSDFDRDHAWPGFSYIIISVQKGEAMSYRSWQLNQNRESFMKEDIKIVEEKK
jgi:proteasome lid subunit RPN8/RPN11